MTVFLFICSIKSPQCKCSKKIFLDSDFPSPCFDVRCTKSIKFQFHLGTKLQDQKQEAGNDFDAISGLQALRKTDFSDISYFLINNTLLYHFLAN